MCCSDARKLFDWNDMNIRAGEIVKSPTGAYYRVVELQEESVSLMRINGFTLFSCHPSYLRSAFEAIPYSDLIKL
jgi:hypothetical protein